MYNPTYKFLTMSKWVNLFKCKKTLKHDNLSNVLFNFSTTNYPTDPRKWNILDTLVSPMLFVLGPYNTPIIF